LQRRLRVGGQRLRRQQGSAGGIGRAGAPPELDDVAAGFAADADRIPKFVVLEGGEAGAVAVADRVEQDRGRGGRIFMLLPAGEEGGVAIVAKADRARLRKSAPSRSRRQRDRGLRNIIQSCPNDGPSNSSRMLNGPEVGIGGCGCRGRFGRA
jgi:hypothetical protein